LLQEKHPDLPVVAMFAAAVSVISFFYVLNRGWLLLYGDAVAHMNIARRVFDSLTPGFRQLGTVWLPLPHILTIPFVIPHRWWQSGIGGSVVSMAGFVLGTTGIYRLMKPVTSRVAATLAMLIFCLNPNLLYLQATAMTESLYLACFVWAAVFFSEFSVALREARVAEAKREMLACAGVLVAGMLTRYDGWFLAGVIGICVAWEIKNAPREVRKGVMRAFIQATLMVALTPILWLAYNYTVYRNPVEFATGPYSAKGIEARTSTAAGWHHPGYHHPGTAYRYFVKAAKLNMGPAPWHHILMIVAVLATLVGTMQSAIRPLLVLWTPLAFYSLSLAYGGVPIFIPVWWPFSLYNVRYGLQLLPALAVFFALGVAFVRHSPIGKRYSALLVSIAVLLVAIPYALTTRETPICLREAQVNAVTRDRFERALAAQLQQLPAGSKILIYTSEYVGALQKAGIPLRQTVNEANYDLWQIALNEPAKKADYVVAVDHDPVAAAVSQHPQGLVEIGKVNTEGKPPAIIYRSTEK